MIFLLFIRIAFTGCIWKLERIKLLVLVFFFLEATWEASRNCKKFWNYFCLIIPVFFNRNCWKVIRRGLESFVSAATVRYFSHFLFGMFGNYWIFCLKCCRYFMYRSAPHSLKLMPVMLHDANRECSNCFGKFCELLCFLCLVGLAHYVLHDIM